MLITSFAELDRVREECYSIVRKRAIAAAAVAMPPIPGIGLAGDIAIMMELITAINKKFGLSNEQVEALDANHKILVHQMIKKGGSALVGAVITEKVIKQVLQAIAKRVAIREVGKYIPFIGPLIAGGAGYLLMKYMGDSHVEECYKVAKMVLEQEPIVEERGRKDDPDVFNKDDIVKLLKMLKELFEAGLIPEAEYQDKVKDVLSKL